MLAVNCRALETGECTLVSRDGEALVLDEGGRPVGDGPSELQGSETADELDWAMELSALALIEESGVT